MQEVLKNLDRVYELIRLARVSDERRTILILEETAKLVKSIIVRAEALLIYFLHLMLEVDLSLRRSRTCGDWSRFS